LFQRRIEGLEKLYPQGPGVFLSFIHGDDNTHERSVRAMPHHGIGNHPEFGGIFIGDGPPSALVPIED
jgi:hypothetical protein